MCLGTARYSCARVRAYQASEAKKGNTSVLITKDRIKYWWSPNRPATAPLMIVLVVGAKTASSAMFSEYSKSSDPL